MRYEDDELCGSCGERIEAAKPQMERKPFENGR